MSDQELFIFGLAAFILLIVGVAFTVSEFNKLGKALKNNADKNS